MRVSVHDDGAGPSGRASSTAHGIVGMREQAAAYCGTLRTGARPDHLAETTVKSRVQSMLGKLGVRDRLQAAVAAYDAGLVRPRGC